MSKNSVSSKWQQLPELARVLFAGLLLYTFTTSNPGVGLFALLTLAVIFYQLWVPGHPPVLFVCLLFQWIQASTRIVQANVMGLSLNDYDRSFHAEPAVFLALISILVFSLVAGPIVRSTPFDLARFQHYLEQVNLERVLVTYVLASVLLPQLSRFGQGGLAQIVYSMQGIKWALYSLFLLAAFQQNRYRIVVYAVFGFELLLGFSGYFSSYREVLLITFITMTTIWYKIRTPHIFLLSLGGAIAFTFFIVWTGVKGEYRQFLSGREDLSSQQVIVSRSAALSYLGVLVANFDGEDFKESMEKGLDRLQYTQMIQRCMDYVPRGLPYQNGAVWWSAITHIFMPRILFPDKPVLDDSANARRFTGMQFTGIEKGTSISVGYVAESYVDFGSTFFFIPSIFLAILLGSIYRYLLSASGPALMLNVGMIIPILLTFQLLETVGNKIVGGLIMSFLVFVFIIQRWIYPMLIEYFSKGQQKRKIQQLPHP